MSGEMNESTKETRYDSKVQRLADTTHSLDMTVLAVCEIARLSHTKAHGKRIRQLIESCKLADPGRDSVQGAKPQEFKPKPGWLERQGKNAEVTMAKIDEAFGRAEPATQEPTGEAVAGSRAPSELDKKGWQQQGDSDLWKDPIGGKIWRAFHAMNIESSRNGQERSVIRKSLAYFEACMKTEPQSAAFNVWQTHAVQLKAVLGKSAEPAASAAPSITESIKESRRRMGQCVKCGEMPDECTCDPAAPQKENSDER